MGSVSTSSSDADAGTDTSARDSILPVRDPQPRCTYVVPELREDWQPLIQPVILGVCLCATLFWLGTGIMGVSDL